MGRAIECACGDVRSDPRQLARRLVVGAIDRTAAGARPRGGRSRPADRRSRDRLGGARRAGAACARRRRRGRWWSSPTRERPDTARWSRIALDDPLLVHLCPRLTPFDSAARRTRGRSGRAFRFRRAAPTGRTPGSARRRSRRCIRASPRDRPRSWRTAFARRRRRPDEFPLPAPSRRRHGADLRERGRVLRARVGAATWRASCSASSRSRSGAVTSPWPRTRRASPTILTRLAREHTGPPADND